MSKLSIFPEKFINIEYQIYFLHNIYMYNSNYFTDLSTNIHYLRSIVQWQLPYELILSLEDCFQIPNANTSCLYYWIKLHVELELKQTSSTIIYKFIFLAQERNDYSRKNKKKKYPNLPASRDQMFDVVLT